MEVRYSGVDELLAKFKAAPPAMRDWKKQALGEYGQKIYTGAIWRVPVDAGNLRNSIEQEVTEDSVIVYSDEHYAPYVELGTSRMAPQPYMIPSLYAAVKTLPAAFLSFVKRVFW